MINTQSSQQILDNLLWHKTLIEVVKWLAKYACAFRGYDESSISSNGGNFIELIKLLGLMNENSSKVVLDFTPINAKYISSKI